MPSMQSDQVHSHPGQAEHREDAPLPPLQSHQPSCAIRFKSQPYALYVLSAKEPISPIIPSIAFPVQWKLLACTSNAGGDSSKSSKTCPGTIQPTLPECRNLLFRVLSPAASHSPACRGLLLLKRGTGTPTGQVTSHHPPAP